MFDETSTRYNLFAAYFNFITKRSSRMNPVEEFRTLAVIVHDATKHPECADLVNMLTVTEEAKLELSYTPPLVNPILYTSQVSDAGVIVWQKRVPTMEEYGRFDAKVMLETGKVSYRELVANAENSIPAINQSLKSRIVHVFGNTELSLDTAADIMGLQRGGETLIDACAHGKPPHEWTQEGDPVVHLKDILYHEPK